MKITINIKTNNAAFEDNPGEVQDIIEHVAVSISSGMAEGPLWDSNGNRVGNYKVTGK